jgi:hypothetical protein
LHLLGTYLVQIQKKKKKKDLTPRPISMFNSHFGGVVIYWRATTSIHSFLLFFLFVAVVWSWVLALSDWFWLVKLVVIVISIS